LFLRSGSPQNVYLLPQHPNFRLERCPRPKQICDHPNNEPDKISHPATASPDSRTTASQIEFAIGTRVINGPSAASKLGPIIPQQQTFEEQRHVHFVPKRAFSEMVISRREQLFNRLWQESFRR